MPHKIASKKHSYSPNRGLLAAGLLALALTLAAAVTSTYAFFTTTSAAQVGNLRINMNLSNRLLLGMKNASGQIDYASNLSSSYIDEHSDNYFPGRELGQTSGMYRSSWDKDGFDYATGFPQLRGPYLSSSDKGDTGLASRESYISLEMYFKSDWDGYLYLDPLTQMKADHEENVIRAQKRQREGVNVTAQELDKVADAARISFLSNTGYKILDPNGNGKPTLYAGLLSIDNLDGYYNVDPPTQREIVFGEVLEGAILIWDTTLLPHDVDEYPGEERSSFKATHKAGTYRFNRELTAAANGNQLPFRHELSYSIDDLCLKDGQNYNDFALTAPLAKLESGKDTRVVVSVYLEGWDEDMTNSIGYGAFNLDLSFTALMDQAAF